jgi:hypothetical protein
MYGAVKPWGCKWFQLWRQHIEMAVSLGQRLEVYHFGGMCGQGKIESWETCCEDAKKRDKFWSMKQAFLQKLPLDEVKRLDRLSSKPRDDSKGKKPGK